MKILVVVVLAAVCGFGLRAAFRYEVRKLGGRR